MGRTMVPQISVLPSRPLATKTSGEAEAGRRRAPSVALFEVQDHFPVPGAAKLGRRGQIHARPGVHVILAIGRESDGVIAVGFGESGEAGAVEVDAVVVGEVGVLAGVHTAGFEPDLAFVVVDIVDIAHHPIAPGDLVLHLAGEAVVQVEVLPAVALGGPDDFFAVVDVVAVGAAGARDRGPSWL